MDENKIILETRLVGNLVSNIDNKKKRNFFIPSYQRGYRWGEDDVVRLLEDVYQNGENSYCLQPIVVRKYKDNSQNNDYENYEVVDGQQRLTTIFLIYKYLHKALPSSLHELFSISYETRKESQKFLEEINQADDKKYIENIDFYFMKQAYDAIEKWFADEQHDPQTLKTYFENHVQVIWYEVSENEDPISLFSRLNIGKIPLTSAELVKAMFLSKSHELYSRTSKNSLPDLTKQEIALQWDMIEQELHNESFWYFLSNFCSSDCSTKIELILDLIAKKEHDNRDKYFTFFYFDKESKERSLAELWLEIQNAFWMLKDWYEDHELYHKIGYLISVQEKELQDIFNLAKGKTKKAFLSELDAAIKDSICINRNGSNTLQDYANLSYERLEDCKKIKRLLLLFNVESVRKLAKESQRFPFDKYKFNKKGQVVWSLEHIHAQHSKGLVDIKAWHSWLRAHISSVRAVTSATPVTSDISENEKLIESMKKAVENLKLSGDEFESIRQKVVAVLTGSENSEYMHSLANMALLNVADNAALNNAAFDVKRNIVIKLIREGNYIPFCTQMVFLKSYTPSKDTQIHFWGEKDCIAYIVAMHKILKTYLKEKSFLKEENN